MHTLTQPQRHAPIPELAQQASMYEQTRSPRGSYTVLCCDRLGTPFFTHSPAGCPAAGRVVYHWH